jgi:hypothetical protein
VISEFHPRLRKFCASRPSIGPAKIFVSSSKDAQTFIAAGTSRIFVHFDAPGCRVPHISARFCAEI